MKLAVTYKNDNIFEHFGHTEVFKVYEILDNKVINSYLIKTNCRGHGALAGFLVENKINALICGGIGDGALKALAFRQIKVFAGVYGSCDEAVDKLLNNTLVYTKASNCTHHDGNHNCGSDENCHCQKN